MIKATKITDEELNQVNELRREFQIVALELGELNLIERNLKEELVKIQEETDNFYSSYKKLQQKEKDLISTLGSTYPDQTINYETGELL